MGVFQLNFPPATRSEKEAGTTKQYGTEQIDEAGERMKQKTASCDLHWLEFRCVSWTNYRFACLQLLMYFIRIIFFALCRLSSAHTLWRRVNGEQQGWSKERTNDTNKRQKMKSSELEIKRKETKKRKKKIIPTKRIDPRRRRSSREQKI